MEKSTEKVDTTNQTVDKQGVTKTKEAPLKGTWMSLGVLAGVIFATYILMFAFYMGRI